MNEPRDGRYVAADVLFRVVEDDAYASTVLDRALREAKLPKRDAALATQVCYGTLRVLPAIDEAIVAALHRPDRAVEPWTLAVLRTAAFQLLHMRAPARAVVHASVQLIKRKRGPKLGAFANGVLRKVAKNRPAEPALPETVRLPTWLEERLRTYLSAHEFEAFVHRPLPPPTGLLTFSDADRERLKEELESRGARDVRCAEFPASAMTLHDGGDLRGLSVDLGTRFRVMELGSQIVAASVPLASAVRVADCCAGRGGKTLSLAARLGPSARVCAIELHGKKLRELEAYHAALAPDLREQLAQISTAEVDLSVGPGEFDQPFDVVFVDMPCSGTGTLHRRPELLLRLTPERVKDLTALQHKIAQQSAQLVRPGGVLVVAVCSLLPEEGVGLRDFCLSSLTGFEPDAEAALSVSDTVRGIHRVGPWQQNADGFQWFALRRAACQAPPRR